MSTRVFSGSEFVHAPALRLPGFDDARFLDQERLRQCPSLYVFARGCCKDIQSIVRNCLSSRPSEFLPSVGEVSAFYQGARTKRAMRRKGRERMGRDMRYLWRGRCGLRIHVRREAGRSPRLLGPTCRGESLCSPRCLNVVVPMRIMWYALQYEIFILSVCK